LQESIMGLFKRISDIISANLNDMTEGLEDPETMLKQAIREMEQSIEEATKETVKVVASEKLLRKELSNNETQARDWERRAEQAVDSGDDDLARKALLRKQEHDKLVTALSDQLNVVQQTAESLKHQLDGMKAKLAEAKRNLATLSARQKAADFKKKVHTQAQALEFSGSDDAFAKFERMREKVERAEAEAEALAELRGDASPSPASLDKAPGTSPLDDELAKLKAKRGRG
jgi:phage shock protein A